MGKSKQSNIAIVAHSRYGMAHYSYSLARALTELPAKTMNIHLFTNKEFHCDAVRGLDIIKLFSRTRKLPLELIKFIHLISSKHISLIHFQDTLKYPLLTWISILLAQRAGIKVVYTVHDVLPHYSLIYHRWLMKRIYKSADGVIAHSENNRKSILDLTGSNITIETIPQGIYDIFKGDEAINPSEARRHLNIPQDKFVLLFFGRIDERKGAEVLVRNLPELCAHEQRIHLLMAGTTNYAPGYLQEIAEKNGVRNFLSLFDQGIPDSDVALYFAAANVIILPYLEGSSSAVIKVALAFGRKVIATRVGELPEIIETCKAGILVDFPLSNDDIISIASLLKEQSVENNRIKPEVPEEYRWPKIAALTGQLYESVC